MTHAMNGFLIAFQCVLCFVRAHYDSSSWIDGKPSQLSKGKWPHEKYRQYISRPFQHKTFFPLFSTLPLEDGQVYHAITTAVIWIHGLTATANTYFVDGVDIAEQTGVDSRILTIAPWFSKTEVTGGFWNREALPEDLKSIYWNGDVATSAWLLGGNSSRYVAGGSYGAFDILTSLVNQLQAKTTFPDMKWVTVAGFSAGCQMSSRWAYFSDALLPEDTPEVDLQVIASDCSSYMYLDENRPAPSCRPYYDTGSKHTCSSFEKPPDWMGPDDDYNRYKYGLLGATADHPYSDSELETLTKQFPTKNIRFLFGDEDACNCRHWGYRNPKFCFHEKLTCTPVWGHSTACCDTYPDTFTDNVMDNRTTAAVQGHNRLQRGLNYMAYLRNLYKLPEDSIFPTFGIFHGGHDSYAFGKNDLFREWAYKVVVI